MSKVRGRKARQSKNECKRMITIRMPSTLHTVIIRDAENQKISHNNLLVHLLSEHYQDDLIMTKTDQWKRAETFINKKVSGKDEITGKQITGICYGVDCHVKPMGKRGVFLVVQGPNTLTNYKIDFSTFDNQTHDK